MTWIWGFSVLTSLEHCWFQTISSVWLPWQHVQRPKDGLAVNSEVTKQQWSSFCRRAVQTRRSDLGHSFTQSRCRVWKRSLDNNGSFLASGAAAGGARSSSSPSICLRSTSCHIQSRPACCKDQRLTGEKMSGSLCWIQKRPWTSWDVRCFLMLIWTSSVLCQWDQAVSGYTVGW